MVGGHVRDTTVCDNCSGSHHMKDCPIAKVFTVTADSEGVDYVFMTQDNPESDDDVSCIRNTKHALPGGSTTDRFDLSIA